MAASNSSAFIPVPLSTMHTKLEDASQQNLTFTSVALAAMLLSIMSASAVGSVYPSPRNDSRIAIGFGTTSLVLGIN
jgi:hypothetical protein